VSDRYPHTLAHHAEARRGDARGHVALDWREVDALPSADVPIEAVCDVVGWWLGRLARAKRRRDAAEGADAARRAIAGAPRAEQGRLL